MKEYGVGPRVGASPDKTLLSSFSIPWVLGPLDRRLNLAVQ